LTNDVASKSNEIAEENSLGSLRVVLIFSIKINECKLAIIIMPEAAWGDFYFKIMRAKVERVFLEGNISLQTLSKYQAHIWHIG
jgi:hypothetical protein